MSVVPAAENMWRRSLSTGGSGLPPCSTAEGRQRPWPRTPTPRCARPTTLEPRAGFPGRSRNAHRAAPTTRTGGDGQPRKRGRAPGEPRQNSDPENTVSTHAGCFMTAHPSTGGQPRCLRPRNLPTTPRCWPTNGAVAWPFWERCSQNSREKKGTDRGNLDRSTRACWPG